MSEPEQTNATATPSDELFVTIYVDRAAYRIPGRPMTGRQLRDLPTPGLAYDLDLFQIVAGAGDDLLVRDEELVHIEDGAEFFTAPRTILAG